MEHTTIAVDLAKSVFQIAVSHRVGHVDAERRLTHKVAVGPKVWAEHLYVICRG